MQDNEELPLIDLSQSENLGEDIDLDDCIKSSMLILETLTKKGLSYDQEMQIVCGMLAILKESHPNKDLYNQFFAKTLVEVEAEMKILFGIG